MARTHSTEFFHCNNCGGEVKLTAKVCPHCGADDETAWKDGAQSYIVQETEDFDYDDYMRRNNPDQVGKPAGVKWWVWVIALLLIALFALQWFL